MRLPPLSTAAQPRHRGVRVSFNECLWLLKCMPRSRVQVDFVPVGFAQWGRISLHLMLVLLRLLAVFVANLFKSRWRLGHPVLGASITELRQAQAFSVRIGTVIVRVWQIEPFHRGPNSILRSISALHRLGHNAQIPSKLVFGYDCCLNSRNGDIFEPRRRDRSILPAKAPYAKSVAAFYKRHNQFWYFFLER